MLGRFFGRRRRKAVPPPEPPVPSQARRENDRAPVDASAYDELLADVIASHFEGGRATGSVADLGDLNLRIECSVSAVHQLGQVEVASLFLLLSGDALGPEPVFASVSGYGDTASEAIISGACTWACTFAPVLRSGLAGDAPDGDMDEIHVEVDEQLFRLHVNGFDRVMHFAHEDDLDETAGLSVQVRAALAASVDTPPGARARPWLTEALAHSNLLPTFTSRHTLVSVFVMDRDGQRTVEVKVDGSDWPVVDWLSDVDTHPGDDVVLLRELAVFTAVTPTGARVSPRLTREGVERTLNGLAQCREPGQSAGWQGWWAQDGWLGSTLTDDDLVAVERQTRQLPQDYRRFLTAIAGPGAGPGYGLLQPERVTTARADVIPLAHAGCGSTWVLRLDGPNRGEVWVDASGSDRRFERVAASVTQWYSQWLEATVRDRPFVQWDPMACAASIALQQLLSDPAMPAGTSLRDRLGDASIRLVTDGGYLHDGAPGDPCQGCVQVAITRGLPPTVFVPGILSRPV